MFSIVGVDLFAMKTLTAVMCVYILQRRLYFVVYASVSTYVCEPRNGLFVNLHLLKRQ